MYNVHTYILYRIKILKITQTQNQNMEKTHTIKTPSHTNAHTCINTQNSLQLQKEISINYQN